MTTASDNFNWTKAPQDVLMSIGVYSLENVLSNLEHIGYHQNQINAVRRHWLSFKAAQVRVTLERDPIDGVVAMSGRKRA